MTKRPSNRSLFQKVVYFFPIQLLFVHLKKNQQLLLFWLFLFLILFGQFGSKYGIPLLFVEPEYLGKISIWSYLILGFSFGGFVMAFNISSYIMNGFRFPFLATLSKPFLKYCINNSLIPLIYISCYVAVTTRFLLQNESFTVLEVVNRMAFYLIGYCSFVILSIAYFMATNKDLEKLFGKNVTKVVSSDTDGEEPARLLLHKKSESWFAKQLGKKSWRVDSYVGSYFKLRNTRSHHHYSMNMLRAVFRQNHVNASFFELAVIASILALGLFRENEVFIIPAAATVMLLITMILMATSAIRSWLRGWTLMTIIALFLMINQFSKYDNFYYLNKLYGLHVEESANIIALEQQLSNQIKIDQENELNRLSLWKNRQATDKPYAVIVTNSGGGSRAMLWSAFALQYLDSLTHGELYKHCILKTGSSGGMIGAAYYRALKMKAMNEHRDVEPAAYKNMEKDMLNRVFFNLVVNDMLIKTKSFEKNTEWHWKDRAYAFEDELNKISHGVFDHPLGRYAEPVKNGLLPLMIFSPSAVKDGKRILISSMGLTYLTNKDTDDISMQEQLDVQFLFGKEKVAELEYLSVLRCNSSFPYIMPVASLPTVPKIDLFDSGLRDNYGIKSAVRYAFEMKNWLNENTSGLIVLQIRDKKTQNLSGKNQQKQSLANELLSPLGSLYGNLFQIQDFQNDELLLYLNSFYKGDIQLLNYELNKSAEQPISLSWHLTSKEKEQIYESVYLEENKNTEHQLKTLFYEKDTLH